MSQVNGSILLIGTEDLEPARASLLYAATGARRDPIPARWKAAWDSPFALYLDSPVQKLGAALPIGDGDLPLLAIVCSGGKPGAKGYPVYMAFEFDSAPNALIFSPLCRLFLYAAAHRLWPEKAATILDEAVWRTDSCFVSVSGFWLDAEDIAGLAGMVR